MEEEFSHAFKKTMDISTVVWPLLGVLQIFKKNVFVIYNFHWHKM